MACLALDFARMRFCDEVQEPRAADAEVLAMILFECWSVLFLTILETWIFHDLPIKVKVKKRGLSAFAAFRGHPLQVSLTAFFAADHITLGVEAGSWPMLARCLSFGKWHSTGEGSRYRFGPSHSLELVPEMLKQFQDHATNNSCAA